MAEKEKETDENMVEFFSMLLGAKLVGHIQHFKVVGKGSFAKHLALDEFYKGTGEIADTIIEAYQGCSGELIQFDPEILVYGMDMDALEYVTELRTVISAGRELEYIKAKPHIQSELDNYSILVDQTIYKLSFLE